MPIYYKMIPFSNIKPFRATYERGVLTKLERGRRERGYQPLSRIEGISRSGTGSNHSRKRGKKSKCEENKERKPVSEWIDAVHDDALMASQETREIVDQPENNQDQLVEIEALRLSTQWRLKVRETRT